MSALYSYVVYDHPDDMPAFFIARRFENDQPTSETLYATDLEWLRFRLQSRGLMRMPRAPQDDPKIVEVWM